MARAKGTNIRLMLNPTDVLDFIDVSYQDPQTPIDDLKLPPGPGHVLTVSIAEEKWKFEMSKRARKEKTKKKPFLKNIVLSSTLEQLISAWSEIKNLSEEYSRYHAD